MAPGLRMQQATGLAKKARTPAVASRIFVGAAIAGAAGGWLLHPRSLDPIVLISGAATGIALLLWLVALWDLLASLRLVPEIAPLDNPPSEGSWVGRLLAWMRRRHLHPRRVLPPVALLLGYCLGHLFWF